MTKQELNDIHTIFCKIAEILRHWNTNPLMFDRRSATDNVFNDLSKFYEKYNLNKK